MISVLLHPMLVKPVKLTAKELTSLREDKAASAERLRKLYWRRRRKIQSGRKLE